MGKAFLYILLFIVPLNYWAQDSLIGIWQDEPVLASGWSNNYRFYENGSYIYSHNQMNCEDSIIATHGKFRIKGGLLILKQKQIEFISGGEYVRASGSCGSVFELVGGTPVIRSKRKRNIYSISMISKESVYEHLDYILIGKKKYWKLGWDPNDY